MKWKKEIKRKQREVFELCFEFVWDFIRDCRENKYVLHPFMSMLLQYQSLPELGQTRVYCEFYNQETEFIR